MQALIEKLFPNLTMEERWTELLAYGGAAWFCVLLAAGGFMLGPVMTPYNNDLNFPGRAHYSIEGAVIGFFLGAVIGTTLLIVRARAKRAELVHAEDSHDEH